ncbi:MAG: adenylate/guanylate cyclase domain-containing protein [Spirochaetota bacterium]
MSTEVFSQLGIGVIITDLQGKIRYTNDNYIGIYNSLSSYEGCLYGDSSMPWVFGQRHLKNKFLPVLRAIRIGQHVNGTMDLQFPDKEPMKVENFATPLRNKKHQVVGAINICFPTDHSSFSDEAQSRLFQKLKKFASNNTWNHITNSLRTQQSDELSKDFVTIAFINIVKFSKLTEELPAKDTLKVLNTFFNRVHNTIVHFNGDVDKYMGDTVLATFSNAEAAIRCFIDILLVEMPTIHNLIQESLPNFPELQVQIGVHSGWVIQGEVGAVQRKDFTIIGQEVNIAGQICSHTNANEMLTSQESIAKIGDIKNLLEKAGNIETKGKQVEVFKFLPESVKINHKVFLYDKEEKQINHIKAMLEKQGLTSITKTSSISILEQMLDKSYDSVIIGPNTSTRDLLTIKKTFERLGLHKDLLIPITQNIDPKTLHALEKFGIKTYVHSKDEKNFSRNLQNSLRTQSIRRIPPKTELSQADVPKAIPAIEEESLPTTKNAAESHSTAKQTSKQVQIPVSSESESASNEPSFSDAILYDKQPKSIGVTTMKILEQEELELFCNNISKIWEYNYQSNAKLKIIIKLDSVLNGLITKDYIQGILMTIFRLGRMANKGWKGSLLFQSSDPQMGEIISEYSDKFRVKFEKTSD